MVDLNSATNDKHIVQIAPSTDSKLNLFHALVLDEAHLRTMDEIVYSYYPSGDKTRTRTEKVVRVERDVGDDPLDVNVTITLQGLMTKVVIAPKEKDPLLLFTDGETYPLCGMMKCSNFKVDDPDLDTKFLDQKVDEIFHEERKPSASQGNGRRLADARRLVTNYGCCSMSALFVVFKATDHAKCNSPETFAAIHNGYGPSTACYGHDMCLSTCDNNAGGKYTALTAMDQHGAVVTEHDGTGTMCECKGKCDELLVADAEVVNCDTAWWDCVGKAECIVRREALKLIMGGTPNGCK